MKTRPHSDDDPGEVEELPAEPEHDDERDDDEPDPPFGEPFALATGCDLLQRSENIPGCWASVRCDCGKAFKIDLLTTGVKPCPGCRLPYSHVLIVAPADDRDVVASLFDELDGRDETSPEGG